MVDLGVERALLPRGRRLVLSRVLHAALAETLADGGQAILFLNRRGFSTRIFCFDCGHAERCRALRDLAGLPRRRSEAALPLLPVRDRSARDLFEMRRTRHRAARTRHRTPRGRRAAALSERAHRAARPRHRRAARRDRARARGARRRAASTSSSARRWSRRATTSRACAWWASSPPTRACTSRTSARPSAPSSC